MREFNKLCPWGANSRWELCKLLNGKFIWIAVPAVLIMSLILLILPAARTNNYTEKITKYSFPDLSASFKDADFPYFEKQLFFSTLPDLSGKKNMSESVKVGIIPHHLIAGNIISDFFSRLNKEKINTVIIVGPNHFEAGGAKIISGLDTWATPFGKLNIDNKTISYLAGQGVLAIEDEIIKKEPSIDSLTPYIDFFLDSPEIIPIIFSRGTKLSEIESLAGGLLPIFKKPGTVLISSVDFSHYIECEQAVRHDRETEEAMSKHNYSHLLKLNNRHLDSPASIIITLLLSDQALLPEYKIIMHTNSCELMNDKSGMTTSYFEIITFDK